MNLISLIIATIKYFLFVISPHKLAFSKLSNFLLKLSIIRRDHNFILHKYFILLTIPIKFNRHMRHRRHIGRCLTSNLLHKALQFINPSSKIIHFHNFNLRCVLLIISLLTKLRKLNLIIVVECKTMLWLFRRLVLYLFLVVLYTGTLLHQFCYMGSVV